MNRNKVGLYLGAIVFLSSFFITPPSSMSLMAWQTAFVIILMAIWWITEAIPVYATGLVPLVLFPLLNILSIEDTSKSYANPLIFLFMGGFMIALSMQRWGLHKRIALSLLSLTGTRQRNLLAGFMISSAFLSMWVTNTATTMMMLPIGLSVLSVININSKSDFNTLKTPLVLSIAYAANIGGLSTLIGTAPNALVALYFDEIYGFSISFFDWMMIGVPTAMVLLFVTWLLLTRFIYKLPNTPILGIDELLANERRTQGRFTFGEGVTAFAFFSAAFLWISRPFLQKVFPELNISDAGIAMTVSMFLFIIPAGKGKGGVLDWEWASKLPWGILILFGGGLSLANAAVASGLSEWIGQEMSSMQTISIVIVCLLVISVVVFLTEVTSNTATIATLLPILAAAAVAIGENPLLLCIPATMAASCAFMLPPATPPNAIVFGSGYVTIPQMSRAGIVINLTSIFILLIFSLALITQVFGVVVGELPSWVGL